METLNKKPFKINKKKYIILGSLFLVFASMFVFSIIRTNIRKTMPLEHVFVCDNPSNDSEFDTWMKEELGLNWVPTYYIVRNDIIVGSIRGGVPEKQFTSELGTILIQNNDFGELPDLPVSSLKGQRDSLKNILPNDNNFYIIEISWITCPDCIFQDENFTEDIYYKYGTNNIYRYYIHSSQEEVLEKYT